MTYVHSSQKIAPAERENQQTKRGGHVTHICKKHYFCSSEDKGVLAPPHFPIAGKLRLYPYDLMQLMLP